MSMIPFADARNRLSELEESLDVLSSPEAMSQLASSKTALKAGDVLDADELVALMAKHARRAE